jgi:hypothetical protein
MNYRNCYFIINQLGIFFCFGHQIDPTQTNPVALVVISDAFAIVLHHPDVSKRYVGLFAPIGITFANQIKYLFLLY